MADVTPVSGVGRPHVRPRVRIGRLVGLAVLLACSCAYAGDAEYLDMLNAEATKVDGPTTDTTGDSDRTAHADGAGPSARSGESREAFENMLRSRHIGTFSLYRRLPANAREEIHRAYVSGAPIEAVRATVVERYLHP